MSCLRLVLLSFAVVLGVMLNTPTEGAPQASVTLAWDASTDSSVAGYHLYVGGVSQNYTNMIDTGSTASGTVSGLVAGSTYYFAVTAYDIAGLESPFSTQVTYTVPATIANLAKIQLNLTPSKQPIVTGTAPAGYVYNVLASKDLKTWTTLSSVTASASGSLSYTDTNTTNKIRYYRLQQTSP